MLCGFLLYVHFCWAFCFILGRSRGGGGDWVLIGFLRLLEAFAAVWLLPGTVCMVCGVALRGVNNAAQWGGVTKGEESLARIFVA